MLNAILPTQFFKTRELAVRVGPKLHFNSDTEYRLRVVQLVSVTEWSVSVAWSKVLGGPPRSVVDVPDSAFAYVEGGVVVEIFAKVWDQAAGQVLLLVRIVERAGV